METLADALPKEQERVRELINIYKSIGPGGAVAVILMEYSLKRAEVAVAAGDVVGMIAAYKELKEYKE